MSKSCFGLDIGAYALKILVRSGDSLPKAVIEPMPDNIIRDDKIVAPEAVSELLKAVDKKHRLPNKRCRLALPSTAAFTRQINTPFMTAEHLKLNLPYEFHDFITGEKEKYFYDYLVLNIENGEDGKPAELELMASAILKESVYEYKDIFRRAGIKAEAFIPEEYAYRNIICAYEAGGESKGEYCFIDLGHTATRLFILNGDRLAATRIINIGGAAIDEAIASSCNVDIHVAQNYKHGNYNGILESESCRDVYARIALEISRAVNFYGFNNPLSNLHDCYFCGGGINIPLLTGAISHNLELNTHSVSELLPDFAAESVEAAVSPAALGVMLQ